MPNFKKIAAKPGETAQVVEFTTAEETQKSTDIAEAAKTTKRDHLKAEFDAAWATAVGNLNAGQRKSIVQDLVFTRAAIDLDVAAGDSMYTTARQVIVDHVPANASMDTHKTNLLAIIDDVRDAW